jgi:large subunit ribosomal protein L25
LWEKDGTMEQLQLPAIRRTRRGKGGARQARREGYIPAVVYGREQDPVPIAVPAAPLRRLLQHAGSNWMVHLRIGEGAEAQEQLAIIKEVQREPISGQMLHLDFQAISWTDRLTLTVPVEVVGEAPGVREGGLLEVVRSQVEVECLPLNIPEHLKADVSGLPLHGTLVAGDLPLPEGVTLLTDPEEPVVVIRAPAAMEASAEGEPAAEG